MTDSTFQQLNQAERRVLRLLAEGHTIKSAAMQIGTTAASLNERLREARRKTSMGSSRELARRLAAQENRDRQIGIDPDRRNPSPDVPSSAPTWWRRAGEMVMLAAVLGLIATTLVLDSRQAATPESNPPFAEAFPDGPTPADWRARLNEEHREGEWATHAEEILRLQYARLTHAGMLEKDLRFECRATVCEVAGVINAPLAGDAAQDSAQDAVNAAMRELQGNALMQDILAGGLKSEGGVFSGTQFDPGRMAFFFYFSKSDASD